MANFYQRFLGLPLVSLGEGYCLLDAGGGATFELWADGVSAPPKKSPREQSVIVAFAVPSLEAAISTLSRRGLKADSDIGSFGDSRWIYYTDPEGNRFELKETIHG